MTQTKTDRRPAAVQIAAFLAAALAFSPASAQQAPAGAEKPADKPAAAGAAVEPLPPARLAVVDMERLMLNSEAGKSMRDQLRSLRERVDGEFKGQSEVLSKERDELIKQKSLLTPEAFGEKQKAFEGRAQAFARTVQEVNRQLNVSAAKAEREIFDKIVGIVKDLGADYRFNAVAERRSMLLFMPGLDISEAVMNRLNAQMRTVKVQDVSPKGVAASAGTAAAAPKPGGAPAAPKPAGTPAAPKK